MSAPRSIVVGTAGHIDHGKTTLIRALTGVNTDRLEEEQKRGITIELGFAPLDVEDVHIGFVDVPGHEKFVKNMLAGAGGIDAMLLVVSADESVMPQTREHVEICRLLGIQKAVAAITKSDIADEDSIELVTLEVTELLEENGFHDVPVTAVSGQTGDGLDLLKTMLHTLADSITERATDSVPRLPIDRVFTMKGHGTVVTGTLVSGELSVGDKLLCYPGEVTTTVKSLQVHGESVQSITAGHRVAINLAGVDVEDIERGSMLAPPDSMPASLIWDVQCKVLESAPCDIEQNMRVRVHAGTAEILARVTISEGKNLAPGQTDIVRLRFESPIAGHIGDRIVIRRYSPMITLAGGIVLDNEPPLFSSNKKEAWQSLQTLAEAEKKERLHKSIELLQKPISIPQLIRRFGYSAKATTARINEKISEGAIVKLGESPLEICSRTLFDSTCARINQILSNLHDAQPLKTGFYLSNITSELPRSSNENMLKTCLSYLESAGEIENVEGKVKLARRNLQLSADQQNAFDTIETAFKEAGFGPPAPTDAIKRANHKDGEALFELLLSQGKLRLISQDYFLHRETLASIEDTLRKNAGSEPFAVPQFKDWLGVSRKYAIPLLEYLDRQGITYRTGDQRKLSRS